MSAERLYVERTIYDEFVEKLTAEVEMLRQGNTVDDDIGSMTFPKQIDIVKDQIEDALSHGAELLTGKHPDEWDVSNGLFLKPMVVVDVKQEMKIVMKETFGPVLPVIPFDTEEEGIRLANDSLYGLNASVWSSNLEKAKRVVSRLVTGNAVINDVFISVANHNLPFGGVKQSGIGRYHGEAGMRIFCHEKSVMVDKGQKNTEVQWYPYEGKYPELVKIFKNVLGDRQDWKVVVKAYRNITKK